MQTFVTFKPCSNAPLDKKCDLPKCENKAVVDCQIAFINTWGYLCYQHFIEFGSKNPSLVNNITDKTILLTQETGSAHDK